MQPARVLMRPEVLRVIGDCAAGSSRAETGGPLVGTVQRSWEGEPPALIVSVLGTVPPGPAVRGDPSSVSLGVERDGERAVAALRWWRAVTGIELGHLGDWHVHPGGFPKPSRGDEMTACRMHAESPAPIWLAGIATGDSAPRFYRATALAGLAHVPVRVEHEAIPALPALPWNITDPPRFAAECRLLHASGYTTSIAAAGESPDLTLQLRRDGGAPITVVTGPHYPQEPPSVLDGSGRRLVPRGRWSAEQFLVDIVGRTW
jgi:hypothetical protein